jgi:hypothetical protein
MRVARLLAVSLVLALGGCPADDSPAGSGRDASADTAGQSGGACVARGEICAGGKTCCDGLACCRGAMIEVGREFCEQHCPVTDSMREGPTPRPSRP